MNKSKKNCIFYIYVYIYYSIIRKQNEHFISLWKRKSIKRIFLSNSLFFFLNHIKFILNIFLLMKKTLEKITKNNY